MNIDPIAQKKFTSAIVIISVLFQLETMFYCLYWKSLYCGFQVPCSEKFRYYL